ncbi:30S ribosomal protein S9 [Spiroplasma endosymbiont of Agriotes lineatus]|uniref:30S ribosomal protein S9 n=1 Tax=Spiroplasma endosymbiont of Agriotes lineatus TaxID=3077930 RepID=UPI0030D08C01
MKKEIIYQGTGRRKKSVAQVLLTPGKGNITINNKPALTFFPYATLVQELEQPLVATDMKEYFDVNVKVNGGGFSGQAGATRLGIARALLESSADYRLKLRPKGLLTRDARIKERDKYGLKGPRAGNQFSKR